MPAALLALLLFAAGYFGAEGLLTILLTTAGHASLSQAGAALSAGGVSWGMVSLLTTRLVASPESRSRLAGAGLAAAAAGTLAVCAVGSPLGIAAWALASAGVGLAYPAVTLAATSVTDGIAAGELATGALIAETFGALLGRSLGSGLASSVSLAGLSYADVLRGVYLLFAALLALAAVVATRLAPSTPAAIIPR